MPSLPRQYKAKAKSSIQPELFTDFFFLPSLNYREYLQKKLEDDSDSVTMGQRHMNFEVGNENPELVCILLYLACIKPGFSPEQSNMIAAALDQGWVSWSSDGNTGFSVSSFILIFEQVVTDLITSMNMVNEIELLSVHNNMKSFHAV